MAVATMNQEAVLKSLFPTNRSTRLPGGYMGKLLYVDLSTGRTQDLNLPEEPVLRRYWGGQALGEYILLHLLRLDARPFDVDAPIIMMTGPVTGTGLTPGGTKMTSVFLSPATKYTLGRAATSGFWAVALKSAGYDGLIITGQAQKPTYLYLDDGQVSLRDASRVWGKGTRETEDLLRAEVRRQDARVGCIGPAGENLVHAAMLANDYNHFASHGVGAVMGSKKLKAIVARGTRRPPIHNKPALIQAGERWRNTLQVFSVNGRRSVGHGAAWGAITKHNWRSTTIEGPETSGFEDNRITPRPCFQCGRLCPWDVELKSGDHVGHIGHFDAGSEWLDTFFNLDINGNDVLYLAERINDLGIECSHFADGAGLAFEAWEKGLLGPDRTDGLELKWGDTATVDRLLEMCARREGWLGNLLADGPKELADALGGEAPQWVVHTKSGTPAQHEWRPLLGNMLRELVASGGMKPQGGGSTNPAPDLRYREKWGPLDPMKSEGWAWSHLLSEQYRQAGCMGACWFAMNPNRPDGIQCMVDSLNATTGWDVTLDELLDAGHRSMLLQSIFGTQRGWRASDDWTNVGPRFLEPIPDGKYKGFTIAQFLPDLIQEYYRLSGRDENSGRPLRATLERLELEEFMEWSDPEMTEAPIRLVPREQLRSRRPYPTGRLHDGKPRAILFDSSKCIGCRQCVEACKDWNDLPRGNQYRIDSSTWLTMEPPVMDGTASVWGRNSCMHCEFPACAAVCPVEAITKYAEGPVVIDPEVCIGCEYCVYACPWHVISKNEVTGKSTKCTGCADRQSAGLQPFCVQACPVNALSFGLVAEMETQATERAGATGGAVYGQREAGGTHVFHVLIKTLGDHGLPRVSALRYPRHHIPMSIKIGGVVGMTGGWQGKVRSVTNALFKPWRLKYRYWQTPGR